MSIFGGSNRAAPTPATIGSVTGLDYETFTGLPQYVSLQAVGGAATFVFHSSEADPGGTYWTLADGETVDVMVGASNPVLVVKTGVIVWAKS